MRGRWAAALALVLATATSSADGAEPARARAQIRISHAPDAPYELLGVSFPDSRVGYAAGANGTLLATRDGGASWSSQQPPVKDVDNARREALSSISFADDNNGHAVGFDGTILVTADGGGTWSVQPPPPTPVVVDGTSTGWSFRSVSFSNPQVGSIVGGAAILTTTDGGRSWTLFGDPHYGSLMGVSSIDALHAQVVARAGQVDGVPFVTIASSDGGRSWEPRPADFGRDIDSLNFNAVSFSDPLHGHAVGPEGRIVATDDGGRTWKLQRARGIETLTGVAFADERRGLVVGTVDFATGEQRAVVFATDDGGRTWVSRLVPDTVRLRGGVDFADRDTAFAVGCRRDTVGLRPGIDYSCADGAGAIVEVAFAEPSVPAAPKPPLLRTPVVAATSLFLLAVWFAIGRRRRAGS